MKLVKPPHSKFFLALFGIALGHYEPIKKPGLTSSERRASLREETSKKSHIEAITHYTQNTRRHVNRN